MFYGIEKSTDLREPRTVVKKFNSLNRLLKWMKAECMSGRNMYPDPDAAQNYHHVYRYGYELAGRINWKDSVFKDMGTRDYPMYDEDRLRCYIEQHGVEILDRTKDARLDKALKPNVKYRYSGKPIDIGDCEVIGDGCLLTFTTAAIEGLAHCHVVDTFLLGLEEVEK